MQIVDTDVLIDVQRGFGPAVAWFKSLTELPAVTGYTVLELLQDARDLADVERVFRLVRALDCVWPNPTDCESALRGFGRLRLAHGVGLLDVLIAYTAIGRDAELLTFNDKHFRAIPELRVRQPYPK